MSKWIIHSAIMAGCFFLAHSTAMAQVQSFFGAGQKQAVTQPSAQKPSVSPPLSPQEYKASVNQRYQQSQANIQQQVTQQRAKADPLPPPPPPYKPSPSSKPGQAIQMRAAPPAAQTQPLTSSPQTITRGAIRSAPPPRLPERQAPAAQPAKQEPVYSGFQTPSSNGAQPSQPAGQTGGWNIQY
ncbi:hypothetical protein [Aquicella lusitana]|uniref:Uncharacterized protein n=1 Tax=Aquicella lusitana TaxID=254246 RepID=A0A370GCZ6_9COXI|nr:hypothetical protein [Aquicella lusitana]RDI41685.1 hypothetical protein C8D86_1188 [Aquicella lusitana]VVC72661.1 hypothetical protein AQULUS_03750 [Aquicella lusitana]